MSNDKSDNDYQPAFEQKLRIIVPDIIAQLHENYRIVTIRYTD